MIDYYDVDFLNSSRPLVVAATAKFSMRSGLAGALNPEMSNVDFLFSPNQITNFLRRKTI